MHLSALGCPLGSFGQFKWYSDWNITPLFLLWLKGWLLVACAICAQTYNNPPKPPPPSSYQITRSKGLLPESLLYWEKNIRNIGLFSLENNRTLMSGLDGNPEATHIHLSTNCQPTSSVPGPLGAVKGIKQQPPNSEGTGSGIPTTCVPGNLSLSRKSLVYSKSRKCIPTT